MTTLLSRKFYLGYFFAFFLAMTAPLAILETGCSTAGGTAHKAEVATIPTVNVAIDQWKAFVAAKKATQAQADKVKEAYGTYYAAQLIAKNYEKAWITSKSEPDQQNFVNAANDASAKGAIVVSLITLYMTVH